MKKVVIRVLFILLLFAQFLPISLSIAQAEKATLTVYVQDNSGEKLEGIDISVTGPGNYDGTKSTGSEGTASFTELIDGDYVTTINLLTGSNYELVAGESSSKTRTLSAGDTETVYFHLKLKTTDETNGEEEETTGNAEIPTKFYQTGSTTTDISDYTEEQLASIKNFTLHIPDFAKIVFTQSVDLSSKEAIGRLKGLDQYVFLDQKGEVAIASDLMPELNKPATITLYGLNFESLGTGYSPVILKDDNEANSSEVTNVTLTGANTITFDVKGFSAYAVRPTLTFEETELETDQEEFTLEGKIDDLDSEFTVFLNDKRQDSDVTINDDGTFSLTLKLKKGENTVQVSATGASEQTFAEIVTINYKPSQGSGSGTDWTMIAGIGLIGLGLVCGGVYYYKTKYLPKKRATQTTGLGSGSLKKSGQTGDQFDSRLLTPEERAVFGQEK